LCTKKTAHRIKLIFGLTDLKASELHGNLSQTQRLEALDKFKNKEIDFLIATDLAARGLDIIGIQTVVNYDMPTQLEPYLHRVGRTARAGASGKAVSFITDDSRKLLKKILKTSKEKMQNRVIPIDILENNRNKIEGMEDNIKQIILEEHEDREIRIAERDAAKAQNLVEHADEIKRRPQRTWFQSETQKKLIKDKAKGTENTGNNENQPSAKVKRKRDNKEDRKPIKRKEKKRKTEKEEDSTKVVRIAAKSAKSKLKAKKLHSEEFSRDTKHHKQIITSGKTSKFDSEKKI